MSHLRKVGGGLVRAGSIAWLIVHFLLTIAYVLPVNPLMLTWQSLVDRTIGQRWTLFAPDPLTSDYSLLVRPLIAREAKTITSGNLPTDGWYDLSTPLWDEFRKNRLSAFDRLYRPQMSAIQDFLSGGDWSMAWRQASRDGDPEARKVYEQHLEMSRRLSITVLTRVADAFINHAFPDHRWVKLALQIRIRSAVPWSKRETQSPSVSYIEVGIFPIDRNVYPADFYAPNSGEVLGPQP